MSDINARTGFAILAVGESADGYATLPSGVKGLSGEALFGLGPDQLPRLLVPVSDSDVVVADSGTGAIRLRRHELVGGESTTSYLEVVCLRPHLLEVFSLFVDDVLGELSAGSGTIEAAMKVLDEWRELLSDATATTLGTRRLAGFLGELIVLIEAMPHADHPSVAMWTGPNGGIHDVALGSIAIEVKTTTSRKTRTARIHGLEQLEIPDGGALAVASVRLVPDVKGATSLRSLIKEVSSMGVSTIDIYRKAASAGIDAASLARNDGMCFKHYDTLFFRVVGDFPRLTRESMANGLPTQLCDIEYTLRLDDLPPTSSDIVGLIDSVGRSR